MLQVSGLKAIYDPSQPAGQRLREVWIGERALDVKASYTVATLEILAQGGDAYVQFADAGSTELLTRSFADALLDFFAQRGQVDVPPRGRLIATPR